MTGPFDMAILRTGSAFKLGCKATWGPFFSVT